jgi:hypothetical protein
MMCAMRSLQLQCAIVCGLALAMSGVALAQQAEQDVNADLAMPKPATSKRATQRLNFNIGKDDGHRVKRKSTKPPADADADAEADGAGIVTKPAQPRTAETDSQSDAHYAGVTPGHNVAPPHPPRGGGPVRVTWTGFQMKPEGGSRVFMQLTGQTPYEVRDGRDGLEVVIKRARLNQRNNGRALDTQHFASPVRSVHAVDRSGDVVVSIDTRGRSVHSEKIEGEGGYQYLMIDFQSDGPVAPAAAAKTDE